VLRAVLDTNVLVSSLLVKEGPPARVLDAWRDRRFLLATSPDLMDEMRAALAYPRIRRKYHVLDEEIEHLADLLERNALILTGNAEALAGVVPDDPADEMVLACAVEAQADVIVSGDRHLLEMGEHEGIAILTVRAFLERLDSEPTASGT